MRRFAACCAALALAACTANDLAAEPPAADGVAAATTTGALTPRSPITDTSAAATTTTLPPATLPPATLPPVTTTPVTPPVPAVTSVPTTTGVATTSTSTTSTTTAAVAEAPLGTACRSVVHIGDSTGLAMWTPADMGGDGAATLEAQYRATGVTEVYPDNSGGRSMVERLPGQSNAVEVAETVRASGYRGCWVLMIGTNDAANVAAGGVPGLDERIADMMAIIGSDPVLWVNAISRSADPAYPDAAMQQFNAALARAATVHDNLHVLDWAGLAQPDWFTADGLHYTTAGRAWRAAITAQALARAVPRHG